MASDVGLVCFDLGRVLVRICRDWRHACEVAGLTPPPAERFEQHRARVHDAVCRVEVGQISPDAFCADLAPAFGLQPREAAAVLDGFTRGPYDGAVELLDELKRLGVATACLSNTNERHWQLMNDPASHTYFPFSRLTHAFASHEVKLRKPDDAIYRHVERVTGVPGEKIAFFDDVLENVEAAKRCGWQGCWIDPAPDDPLRQVRRFLAERGLRISA